MIAVALVLALAAHLAGAERVWRRAGRGRAVRGRHVASWAAGLAVLAAALLTPLERLSGELLTAHVVQHLLLVLPAPVLLVLGRPALPLAHLIGVEVAGRVRRLRLPPGAALGLAWTAHVVVVTTWHLPRLYQAALTSPAVHAAEHLTLLATAVALWAALLRRDPRGRTRGAAVLAAAATGLVTGAVGVVLVFAPQVAYPAYRSTAPLHGMSAADDQVIAGMAMWAVGGLAYVAATCGLLGGWLGALERVAARRAASAGAWLLVLAVASVGCTTRGTPSPTADVLGDIDRGRELTLERGCVTCHDVPGVAARGGRVGPPLGGFAERRTIAGTLPHTPANLVRWLEDPQEVLPGNVMPDVGLTAGEAEAIAAFLSTLD